MIKKRFLGAQSFINQFKMKESEYYYKRHSREEISGVKVRTFTLNAKFQGLSTIKKYKEPDFPLSPSTEN